MTDESKTKAKRVPTLKPQPHGGALWAGPAAHPVPGPGRPPNALRALMRGHLDEVIPEIHRKWKAGEIDDVQYAEYLAKYAIGPLKGISADELDRFAAQVAEVVFEVCGREAFARVSARLAEIRRAEERGT
ncbi:MAG TPA: hypothetical protein VF178_09740 [Gemmatimonadaceae bacterium]